MHIFDRPLLLGLIALERELISPTELIDAFRTWRRQPDSSLGRILAERGNLSDQSIKALEEIVAESFQADGSRDNGSNAAERTKTWNQDTASLAGDAELTTSFRSSRMPNPPAADLDAAFAALRYRPLRLHAMGGLGQVFVADDLELHRQVALKEIRDTAADDGACRRRFIAEAEITGKLEHPGIVPVYGLGVYPDGRPFYAMRFIEGETLGAAIKNFHQENKSDFASLKFRHLLARVVGVCNAVGFAHSRGIVHRDLKPQNVMLGPFGETLVVDWGLAKPLKGASAAPSDEIRHSAPDSSESGDTDWATLMGEIVGTPAYMSPEQAAGRPNEIGPASDVYGLGAILYVLLTGQPPLTGSIGDIRSALERRQIPHPRQIKPQAPRALAAICLKAMSAAPADRYATALDLAADIDRWLAGEAASAYAEPWTDTAFRWIRKHRLPVAVASAILLAVSIALAVGYVLVRNERDIAQAEREKAVAANERAQQSAEATRQVVEQFLINVGDDRWSQIPGFEELRLEMVKLAVDRYRQLLRQQPDDAALAADAAQAFHRCANLYRMVGRFDPARSLYDEAVTLFRAAAAAKPQVAAYERRLCETLIDRALLIRRVNGPKAAEGPLREALSAGRALQKENPKSWDAVGIAARAQFDVAEVLFELGRESQGIDLAKVAMNNLRQAAQRVKSSSATLLTLYPPLSLAEMLRKTGRLADAKTVLDDAIERASRELAAKPEDTNVRFIVVKGRFQRALIDANEGAPSEVQRGALADAIQALDQLVTEFSKTASFRRNLAEALTAQAGIELHGGRHDAAAVSVGKAIAHLEQLDGEEDSPAVFQPLLGSAYITAAEAEFARGDRAAGKAKLQAAQRRLDRARQLNPESQRLIDEAARANSLLDSLDR